MVFEEFEIFPDILTKNTVDALIYIAILVHLAPARETFFPVGRYFFLLGTFLPDNRKEMSSLATLEIPLQVRGPHIES